VAAPTAGLHFTEEILDALRVRKVEIVSLSLHVSWATFRPLRVERVEEHKMHEERVVIPAKTAEAVNRALAEGRRITAVGTTVVRSLEGRFSGGRVIAGDARTDLFIYPRFHFHVVGRLLTNFHFPRSSLILLVAAFGGTQRVLAAYREAVAERYRFFSYGDCMLINPGVGSSA
jgi:S-adenosylmethionine:tRNA ribosyltransferase-isomerase